MNVANEFVVETVNLTKRYGSTLVLDSLDLHIPCGGVHAIVGANGAGKSTLFRILLGFLAPSGGQARILGRDSQLLTPEDRGRIGFVNEEHTLPGWMRVHELIEMQRRQYSRWSHSIFDSAIGRCRLVRRQRISQLSRGERAVFNLALALAQRPQLLLLDEPTLGLDVVAKRAFLESLLQDNVVEDCTIIYCSHQMDEIERVADNLIVLGNGQLRHMSTPEAFCARVTYWVADIPFKGPAHDSIPGLLEARRLAGLHHYLVLDQNEGFADFLHAAGARSINSMPVSLDRAVNAFLGRGDTVPFLH